MMKAIRNIVLGMGLSLVALSSAQAALRTAELVSVCKISAMQEFSTDANARVKFKGVHGPINAKQVRIMVLPKGAETYQAACTINARTSETLVITKLD